MDPRRQRLELWRTGSTAGPVRLEAELTDRCNLRCVYCWQRNELFPRAIQARQHPGIGELEDHHWLRIVDESAKLGVLEWHICGGGEPLVRGKLAGKLIAKIKASGMYGLMTTNGTLLDDDLATVMVHSGWDMVEISLESPTAEPNDLLRGKGSHGLAVAALTRLASLKKRLGLTRPRLEIAIVLCNQNYRLLSELIRFAHTLECQKLSVNPIVTPLGAPQSAKDLRLNAEDLKLLPEALAAAVDAAREYGMDTNAGDFLATKYVEKTDRFDEVIKAAYPAEGLGRFETAHCYTPWTTMAVRPNGQVGPCVAFRYGEGDPIRSRSLTEVWYGEYFTRVREQILQHEPPDYCARCCAPFLIEAETMRKRLHDSAACQP